MKRNESSSNHPNTVTTQIHAALRYQKVKDARKRAIRGLWRRGKRFYARLSIEDESGRKQVRWIPLIDNQTKQPVETAPQAVAALERLKVQRSDNALPTLGRTPKLSEY